jgi:ABC-2 type transport system permease protein
MRASLKRIVAVIQKEGIQLFRDKRALLMIMGLPLIELLLFAYAVHLRVDHIPTAVADQSLDGRSRDLVNALQVSGYFDMDLYVADEAHVIQAIDQGRVKAGIVIPPDFAARVEHGDAQALVVLDGSDSFIVNSGYSAAAAIAQTQSVALTLEKVSRMGAADVGWLTLQTSIRVLYNPDLKDMIFLLPGLSAMLLQMLAINVASVPMVRERELGTLEQILVTPTRPLELVIGKLVAPIAVVVVDLLIVFLLSIFWFGVPFQGNAGLFAGLALLFILSGLGLGLLVSTVSRTQKQAQQFNSMLMLLGLLLTGMIYPRAPMPVAIQLVGDLIPLTYFVRITRGIITKGVGISFLWNDVLALAIYSVVVVGLAAVTFKKRLD